MALARVVAFEDVTQDRIDRLRDEIASSEGPPDGVPASELLLLHDPEGERSLAILFFESEDDYTRGDAALDAMQAEETPGRRVSIAKYRVTIRTTPQGATI